MNYPACLYQKNRKKQDDSQIKNDHFIFMRNKPGYSWNIKDDIPDFSQIPFDQSFNWCKYSLPHWVRYNETKNYLIDYAVIGIKSKIIRYTKKFDNNIEDFSCNIAHKPISINYSHCELCNKVDITKVQRRAFRLILKQHCKIYLKPKKEFNLFIMLYLYIRMLLHKII
jgi:hypothetical protein